MEEPSKKSVVLAPSPETLNNNLFVVLALILIFALPSNAILLMDAGLCNLEAVLALPEVFDVLSGISAATNALY